MHHFATVTDFATGAGGDRVELTQILNILSGYDGSNPFGSSGFLRLVQDGADTLLQGDQNGGGNSFTTLFRFQNTTATSFTSDNFTPAWPTDGSTPSAQTITGTASGETINGTIGNDIIDALGGDDTVNGDAGADTIYGGAGADTLRGGFGADYIEGVGRRTTFFRASRVTTPSGAGTATIVYLAEQASTLCTATRAMTSSTTPAVRAAARSMVAPTTTRFLRHRALAALTRL